MYAMEERKLLCFQSFGHWFAQLVSLLGVKYGDNAMRSCDMMFVMHCQLINRIGLDWIELRSDKRTTTEETEPSTVVGWWCECNEAVAWLQDFYDRFFRHKTITTHTLYVCIFG